jgi:hypothetical protein
MMLSFLFSHRRHIVQGISLEYLKWIHTEFDVPSLDCLTTSQFEKMFLRPRTSRRRCSVINELAADAATAHHVKPATWFISHTWNNPFSDTLEAILNFFDAQEDSTNVFVWFDVFVDSQHSDVPSKSPQWYMTTFQNSIARIGGLLLVVDRWNNPSPLRRAWYEYTRACVRGLTHAAFAGVFWNCTQLRRRRMAVPSLSR